MGIKDPRIETKISTKKIHLNLTREEELENELINSQRVIIENFFGRLKIKFEIMGGKFRNEKSTFEINFIYCTSPGEL